MGILVGMVLYPIISETKRHKMIVWACRIAAIPLVIVLFVVLIRNFYKSDPYAGTYLNAMFLSRSSLKYPSFSVFLVSIPILYSNIGE